MRIYQVESDEDHDHVRELFWEYLVWANAGLNEAFAINLDIAELQESAMSKLQVFFPPQGRLLLVEADGRMAGVACMHQIREDMDEVKRMYVRFEFRGQGIGQALVEALITEARQIGYSHLRLDSARFMHAAHSLYRSAGFKEIDPYSESEIPADFQANWIFMEREL